MINLTTGKIKLSPNEIKTVKLPKGKYSNIPIVLLSCINGNNSFTLQKVSKNFFIVSNDTQKSITLNYIVNTSNINSSISQITNYVQPNNLFITGNDGTINFYKEPDSFNLGEINANEYFDYTADESVTYTVLNVSSSENPDEEIFNQFLFDENGILQFNVDMIYVGDLIFNVEGTLDSNNAISDTANIRFNFVDLLYQTNNQVSINYNSASSLDNYLQNEIVYTSSGNAESSAGFFIPTLSENAEENFFVFSTNFTNSPNLELGILSNNIPIYKTTNPDDSLNNRIIANDQGFSAFTYVVLLEDQNNYYFWYNTNDEVWYVSSERFPLNYDS